MGNERFSDESKVIFGVGFPVTAMEKHMDWMRAIAFCDINIEEVGLAIAKPDVQAALIFSFGFVRTHDLGGFAICRIRKSAAIVIF